MRRFISMLGAVCLLVGTAGCHHTAGFCDCDGPGDPCCYGPTGTGGVGNGPLHPMAVDEVRPVPADRGGDK